MIPNAATERWLRDDPRGPAGVRLLNQLTAPLAGRLPIPAIDRVAALQRPGLPIYSPRSPLVGDADALIDSAPLYAGDCVGRIGGLRGAAELTFELAG